MRPLPTIRSLNEAPHQLPPQNHEGIIAKQRRFHTARVKSWRRSRSG
jgi:hypothetical protein